MIKCLPFFCFQFVIFNVLYFKLIIEFFYHKNIFRSIMSSSPSSIFLGFALEMDQNELFSLDRQFLPLGKIGGFPAWLDPVNVPKAEELACSNCQSPMAFILQIYCPGQTNQPHAFHRVLYIFACRNGQCSKTNDASNFAAFRCQLPRQNPFYSPTESLNPTLVGDVPDPFFNAETFAKLCIVCGARAEKRCSKCSKRMYCSKAHQIIDWRTIHKEECPQQKDYSAFNSTEKWELRQKHGFTFREYGMEMEATAAAEDGQNNQRMDGSDDEEDEEEELSDDGIREEKKRIRKFEELAIANGITSKDIEGLEENRRDVAFKQFNQAIGEEPEQVIRYWRGGKPQLATDFSPAPKNIPQCQLCQCPRHFEFQLMPHLLQLIGVDSVAQSLDWATLLVYTCSNDCPIPEGYEREYAFKQDFVMAPKEDEEK